MTDKSLLELAAKAAGIPVYESTDGSIQNRPILVFTGGGGMGTMQYEVLWNPLADDAQAFQLAVSLLFEISVFEAGSSARTPSGKTVTVLSDEVRDKYAATRRAIVMMAAEIGEEMELV